MSFIVVEQCLQLMTELDDNTEEWLNCDDADEDSGEEYVLSAVFYSSSYNFVDIKAVKLVVSDFYLNNRLFVIYTFMIWFFKIFNIVEVTIWHSSRKL